jgi:hypothetical protein
LLDRSGLRILPIVGVTARFIVGPAHAGERRLAGDLQGSHAGEVHPHVGAVFDNLDQGVVAVRAAQHDPGAAEGLGSDG